jgi:hypothetical protein
MSMEELAAVAGDGFVPDAIVPLLHPVMKPMHKVLAASAQMERRERLRLMIASAGGNPDHNLLQPELRMNDGVVKFAS